MHGILFLDQFSVFRAGVLNSLAQWFADQERCPFLLIGGMAGCPCGKLGASLKVCKCLPSEIQAHRDSISAEIAEWFDLQVEVPSVEFAVAQDSGTDPVVIRERVMQCRELQARRFRKHSGINLNGSMSPESVKRFCGLDTTCGLLLEKAFTTLGLYRRGRVHILKVARTIADMGGSDSIREDDLLEAIAYRALDRRIWA